MILPRTKESVGRVGPCLFLVAMLSPDLVVARATAVQGLVGGDVLERTTIATKASKRKSDWYAN